MPSSDPAAPASRYRVSVGRFDDYFTARRDAACDLAWTPAMLGIDLADRAAAITVATMLLGVPGVVGVRIDEVPPCPA